MSRITLHADLPVVHLERGDSLEGALVKFKKRCLAGGLFAELKRRAYYAPPGVRRRAKSKKAATRRARAARRLRGSDPDWKPETHRTLSEGD